MPLVISSAAAFVEIIPSRIAKAVSGSTAIYSSSIPKQPFPFSPESRSRWAVIHNQHPAVLISGPFTSGDEGNWRSSTLAFAEIKSLESVHLLDFVYQCSFLL